MPSRRSLLASTAGLATATLAGCSSALGEVTRRGGQQTLGEEVSRHYVDVVNGTEEPYVFAVTAADEPGETLFEHEYDLGAREGDENRVIDGTPARVAVVVDGTERVQFPWAPRENPGFVSAYPEGCSDATSASLTVWYGIHSEAEIKPVYGCETVRDP